MPARRCRIAIDEGPDGLRIVIPARRPMSGPILAFFGTWLAFWNAALFVVATRMLKGAESATAGDLGLAFLIGNGLAGPVFLWHLIGREVVHLDDRALTVRAELRGLAWTRTFDPSRVVNLQIIPDDSDEPSGPAFRYDGRRRRFGSRVPEAEARPVVAAIARWLDRPRTH